MGTQLQSTILLCRWQWYSCLFALQPRPPLPQVRPPLPQVRYHLIRSLPAYGKFGESVGMGLDPRIGESLFPGLGVVFKTSTQFMACEPYRVVADGTASLFSVRLPGAI